MKVGRSSKGKERKKERGKQKRKERDKRGEMEEKKYRHIDASVISSNGHHLPPPGISGWGEEGGGDLTISVSGIRH